MTSKTTIKAEKDSKTAGSLEIVMMGQTAVLTAAPDMLSD